MIDEEFITSIQLGLILHQLKDIAGFLLNIITRKICGCSSWTRLPIL